MGWHCLSKPYDMITQIVLYPTDQDQEVVGLGNLLILGLVMPFKATISH